MRNARIGYDWYNTVMLPWLIDIREWYRPSYLYWTDNLIWGRPGHA